MSLTLTSKTAVVPAGGEATFAVVPDEPLRVTAVRLAAAHPDLNVVWVSVGHMILAAFNARVPWCPAGMPILVLVESLSGSQDLPVQVEVEGDTAPDEGAEGKAAP